jgi:hypothetical protein
VFVEGAGVVAEGAPGGGACAKALSGSATSATNTNKDVAVIRMWWQRTAIADVPPGTDNQDLR